VKAALGSITTSMPKYEPQEQILPDVDQGVPDLSRRSARFVSHRLLTSLRTSLALHLQFHSMMMVDVIPKAAKQQPLLLGLCPTHAMSTS